MSNQIERPEWRTDEVPRLLWGRLLVVRYYNEHEFGRYSDGSWSVYDINGGWFDARSHDVKGWHLPTEI